MKKALINLYCFWFGVWFEIKSWPIRTKRFVWNRGIKLQWNRLWVRKDEFHSSLDMDVDAILGISQKQRDMYIEDLCKRRQIAHEKDLMEKSPSFRAIVMNRKS